MSTSERIYVDSNILIYAIEADDRVAALARNSLHFHNDKGDRLYTSEITLGECLRGAHRKGAVYTDAYLDLLINKGMFTLEPVSLDIIRRAALIGAIFNIKLVDAIHVATAEVYGCGVFMTNDRGIRAPAAIELRYPSGIT